MSFWVVPAEARSAPVVLGVGDVQAEEPGGGGVDGHRRVHLVDRDAVHQLAMWPRWATGRRPCRPRRRPRASRGRSRSGWAGRTRSTVRSGPWPGSSGRARWRPGPSSAPSRSASPTAVVRAAATRPASRSATSVMPPFCPAGVAIVATSSGSRGSPARLPAQLLGGDHPSQQRDGGVVGVAELLVQRIQDGQGVSRPTRSSRAKGPIGKPQPPFMAVSMSSMDATPCSSSRTALFR